MIETLTCEAGHTFTRKRARGRKPRYCPEHQPTVVVAKPKATTPPLKTPAPKPSGPNEVLVCEECGQTWARKRTRGRKPRFCPDHRDAPTPVPTVTATSTEPSEAPVAPIQRAQKAKALKVQARNDSLADEVASVLANDFVDDELKRKLKYCQDEIDRGRNDAFITDRRRELLKENKRK